MATSLKEKSLSIAQMIVFICVLTFSTNVFAMGWMPDQKPETEVVTIATSNLLGNKGEIVLINADDLNQKALTLSGINKPQKIVLTSDGTRAFVTGGEDSKFCMVDLVNKSTQMIALESHFLEIRRTRDMALSADESKLIVLTYTHLTNVNSNIEIYDTNSLEMIKSFKINQGLTDLFRGFRITIDPKKDVIYMIATSIGGHIFAQVRAYTFDGQLTGESHKIDSDILDLNNYDIAISPQGDLLMVVSNKIYPFKVNENGLEALNPIGGSDSEQDTWYAGKTKILFTQNSGMIYVNSSGIRIPGVTNVGGSSVCLSKDSVLENDENPFVFSLVDFFNDGFINWIVDQMGDTVNDVADIIDPGQLYGIADSTIEENTCYMVISSVTSLASDASKITDGKYILVIFKTLPLVGNVWVGGRILSHYPNSIAVDPGNDVLSISYWWEKKVGLYYRYKGLGWLLSEEEIVSLEQYPNTIGIENVPSPW
jgi:hypothetical protein